MSFPLPEQDNEFLATLGLPWETLNEANSLWLLIHDLKVPDGYNISTVTAAIQIPPGYPSVQLDMVYFHPHLQLQNGRTIGALTFQSLDGKVFQRWSRHRTATNPWRMGIDDVSTHLALVQNWMEREGKL